jgi:hypothetical protein
MLKQRGWSRRTRRRGRAPALDAVREVGEALLSAVRKAAKSIGLVQ